MSVSTIYRCAFCTLFHGCHFFTVLAYQNLWVFGPHR